LVGLVDSGPIGRLESSRGTVMVKGFKNFLMRGDVVVFAIGLVVALAFSNLVKAFADAVITPLVNRAQGGGQNLGLGWQLGAAGNAATFLNVGAFISALLYFVIFMAVVYFALVLPYKAVEARRGVVVFGDPTPLKTCSACLSEDIPAAASKCRYCGSEQAVPASGRH
jgi:large conductance mechanosensitive channel